MIGSKLKLLFKIFFTNIIRYLHSNKHSKLFFNFISNNPLYKSVLVLGCGSVIAQIIGIISMPIITRLYTPSDFGILAVYSSILAIFGIGATFRYEYAMTIPKSDDDVINLFGLCMLVLSLTTILLALTLSFGKKLLMTYFDAEFLIPYLTFLIIGFIGVGLYTMLSVWAIRQRNYNKITYTLINQGISGSFIKIFLGYFSFGPPGLIIGHIISQIAGIGTLGRAALKKEQLKAISLRGMKHVAYLYKSFPMLNLPSSIIYTLSLQLPPIMLLSLFNSQIAGLYALAYMVMLLPTSAIQGSIQQAYLGEASKMVRENPKELGVLYKKTIRHLFMIALPLLCLPAICAPFIFPIIFGDVWTEAGWYCIPLILVVISNVVVGSTSKLELYGYNHWNLFAATIRFIGVIIGFYVCFLFSLSVFSTLIIYGLVIALTSIYVIKLNIEAISKYVSR